MKITVAGLGVREISQLTLEALEVCKRAEAILMIPVVASGVSERLTELTGRPVYDLKSLYEDHTQDTENYQRISTQVMQLVQKHKNVVLLVPGHPRIGVTLVGDLESKCRDGNIEFVVLPGVSSFCTMINDLRVDPLDRGTLVLDANRFLLFNNNVDPCFNVFIYHVCSVGTSRISLDDPLKDNQLEMLKDRLIECYGPSHEVTLLSSATRPGAGAAALKFKLSEFEKCYPCIHYGTTLYVPSKGPASVNRGFLKLLRSDAVVSQDRRSAK